MERKWTFMVYLAADNKLSIRGEEDIKEMRKIGSTPDVNLLAQIDYSGKRGTERFVLQKDGKDEPVCDLGETDSGDPATLLKFIAWSIDQFPAKRYALVLWGHGTGWERWKQESIAQEPVAKSYNHRKMKDVPYHLAMVCPDPQSMHALDPFKLADILLCATRMIGDKLDLLGMDACLMNDFEVAYQLHSYVKFFVASQDDIPPSGWPYRAVLGKIAKSPETGASDFARHIVAAYIKHYKKIKNKKMPVTMSALDLSRIKEVAKRLDGLATSLIEHMPKGFMEIYKALWKLPSLYNEEKFDVSHFCDELIDTVKSETVKEAAKNVRLALEQSENNFVIANSRYKPKNYETKNKRYCGVSIYFPRYSDVSRSYYDLAYAKDSKWLEMLMKYGEEHRDM